MVTSNYLLWQDSNDVTIEKITTQKGDVIADNQEGWKARHHEKEAKYLKKIAEKDSVIATLKKSSAHEVSPCKFT